MPVPRREWGVDLRLDGKSYVLEDKGEQPPHERSPIPIQPGDSGEPFALEFRNEARGWGWAKHLADGTYHYALGANLHRKLAFLPGPAITALSPGTAPDGPVTFAEFADGTEANRRLIAVSSRYVYEITPAGAIATNDLTTPVPSGAKMTKAVLYKTGTVAARMYIAVQSSTDTNYFIVRTAANTYSETTSNFRAEAICVGVDAAGDYVLWIADPDVDADNRIGLRQSVALADPQSSGSYGAATYPHGETSQQVNDLFQQARRVIVGRTDGINTFNNVAKVTSLVKLPIDADNCRYIKEWNGSAIVPTVIGLLMIDGLDWEPIGPVSSNRESRALRDVREVAFCAAGDGAYAATYDDTYSYIYYGNWRSEQNVGSGSGPFIWHGPIARVTGKITDLEVWTGWGYKLFIGLTNGIQYFPLNDDFSPTVGATSGDIYFPQGALEPEGPGVKVQVDAVEYIAPSDAAMSGSNYWTATFDFGSGYSGPGAGNSGTYQKRSSSSELSGRRGLVKLSYVNAGTAELEAFIVSGRVLPLQKFRHTFRIRADFGMRGNRGARVPRSPEKIGEELRALHNAGWKGALQFGNTSVNVLVTDVREITMNSGGRGTRQPTKYFEVQLDEV